MQTRLKRFAVHLRYACRNQAYRGFAFLSIAVVAVGFAWSEPRPKENPKPDETTQDESTKGATDERIALYTLWLTLLTAVLAISTVGLWRIALVGMRAQSRDMKESLRIADASAKATVAAADAATASSRLALEVERARLIVVLDKHNVGILKNAAQGPDGGWLPDAIRFGFKFRNYGRTPAILHFMGRGIEVTREPRGPLGPQRVHEFDDGVIVDGGADSADFRFGMEKALPVVQAKSVMAGSSFLEFFGEVHFSDIFGGEYQTRFWFAYDAATERMALLLHDETRKKK